VKHGAAFVVVGRKVSASGEFLMDDVPGTSGRLDVLLRCVRAALLTSHGVRRDVAVYLVLGGGDRAPRAVRVTGADVEFLRPDERSLAFLMKKVLAAANERGASFTAVRAGVAVAESGLGAVLDDLGDARFYVLEEGAPDLREDPDLGAPGAAFFIGDHLGFDDATREALRAAAARPLGLGPVSVHAEDAVTIVANELDRRRG
jgi:tRNA (pseudouridine54-N1)-methyltransferase